MVIGLARKFGGGMTEIEFRVLGAVTVRREGGSYRVHGNLRRALLATLLIRANSIVAVDTLAECLWAGDPPTFAAASLHNHVLRLRKALGEDAGARIETASPGYLIRLEDGELDADVFNLRCGSGHRALDKGLWPEALEHFDAALALWRGEPLEDVPLLDHLPYSQVLQETRLQAARGRCTALINLGRHDEVIGELRALTAAHPLDEGFHSQLMLALYRGHRQAEALDVYARLRKVMVSELGVEPTAALRDMHAGILNEDAALEPPPTVAAIAHGDGEPTGGSSITLGEAQSTQALLFQLPADTRVFTGRAAEVQAVLAAAESAAEGDAVAPLVISAIDGMGGAGKSALAVHAAHLLAARFPDGQLFVDLRGNTPGLRPRGVADALHHLLTSLGVPPESVPSDLARSAAYYRSRLAGTRTLILLDDAANAAQVRPLLPGSPGCLVLVTSRRRLSGLDDAHLLTVGMLGESEALNLLRKVARRERVAESDPLAAELAQLCGRLPLAIRIVGARLRHNRRLSLRELVEQLRDENTRLTHLRDEDRDLSAVFESSYASLSDTEQRLFQLLGLMPGVDADAYAAATLLGIGLSEAERLLDALFDRSLLVERSAGHYGMHDLVRAFARALSSREPAEWQGTAVDRLLDYYQHTAHTADRFIRRVTRPVDPMVNAVPGPVPSLTNRAEAMAWFNNERANLMAVVGQGDLSGSRLIDFSAGLDAYLTQEGPWPLAVELHRNSANAAREAGLSLHEATALCDLARIELSIGAGESAGLHLDEALKIYRGAGEELGEANCLVVRTRALLAHGDPPGATEAARSSVAIARRIGDLRAQATGSMLLNRCEIASGRLDKARECLYEALEASRAVGDQLSEGSALGQLGAALMDAGDLSAARSCSEQALRIFREVGNRQGQANVFVDLGEIYRKTGQFALAAEAHLEALRLLEEVSRGSHLNVQRIALAHLALDWVEGGRPDTAVEYVTKSLAICREVNDPLGIANTLLILGRARHAQGATTQAAGLLAESHELFAELADPQGLAYVCTALGELEMETRAPTIALARFRQAQEHLRGVGACLDEAYALEGEARCLDLLNDQDCAIDVLRRAQRIYCETGVGFRAERAQSLLDMWEAGSRAEPVSAHRDR